MMTLIRTPIRNLTIRLVARVCDLLQFETWMAYTLFAGRVGVVIIQTAKMGPFLF